ncbi:tandem-95 repeat protein, partial [bacterium]|nr:tandem-95 repeat protein [bacterium]
CLVCSAGNSDHEADSDIQSYYFDLDGDTFGYGDSSLFCDLGENCLINCVPQNWVNNDQDPEPECYNEAIDDLNVDECGLCNGDNYLNSCADSDSCTLMDCTGQCYGESILDQCGVCNGDGYTCNAPEALDFELTINEDEIGEFILPVTDQNGDPISLELIFDPIHGSLLFDTETFINPYTDATGTYNPDSEFYGLDEFSYYVIDSQGYESNAATGSIIINYIDDTPIASSIELTVNEDQELLITLVGSDIDTDDSNLSFNITQEPIYGEVAPIQRLTDQYNYIPDLNFYGLDTLKYNVSDGTSQSEEAEVVIIVNSINDLPTATIDNNILELDENTSVSGAITINDIDEDAIHLEILQNPSNGEITNFDTINGSFTYEPNDYFSGSDNFSVYAVEDNNIEAKSEVLNITFTVNDVNYNPVAFNQTISMFEDEMLSFNMSGQDIDGNILEFNLIEFPESFDGEAFIDCHTEENIDGTIIEICENDPGWTEGMGNGTYDFGEEFTDTNGNNIWDNASFTGVEGSVVNYVPINNLTGNISFKYKALESDTDELLESELAEVDVTIIPLNDPPLVFDVVYPEIGGESARSVVTDGYQFNLSNYLNDVDNNIEDLIIEFLPELEDTDGDGTLDINTLLGGTLTDLGDFNYQYNLGNINPEIIASDYIVYKAKDGEFESPIGIITFILNDEGQALRDDELFAFDQSIDLPEDEPTVISLIGFDQAFGFGDDLGFDGFNPDLGRDECESDACYEITLPPTNGIIGDAFDAEGGSQLAEWNLEYTPNQDFPYTVAEGQDSLRYRIFNALRVDDDETEEDERWSDEATILFNVFQVNDIPTIETVESQSCPEDQSLTVSLNPIDPDNDLIFSYSVSSEVEGAASLSNDGTNLIITPADDFNGNFSIFATFAEDVAGEFYTVNTSFDVEITPVNDPPFVVELPTQSGTEDNSLEVNLSATDIDGDSNFSYIASINDGSDIIHDYSIVDNVLTIHPKENATGDAIFGVIASDGEDSSSEQNITVNFENLNDFPFIESINPDPPSTIDEDSGSIIFSVNPIDYDPTDNLTIGYVNTNSTLFPSDSISVDISEGVSGDIRTFTLNPASDESGVSIFIITITDGVFTTTKQTVLNVSAVNDPPELISIDSQSIDEDNTFTYELFANDIDSDGLTYSGNIITNRVLSNRSGSLSVEDNILTFIPSSDFFGSIDIEASVSDGEYSSNEIFNLTINSVNDAPEIISDANLSAYTLPGIDLNGQTYNYQLGVNDNDDNSLIYTLVQFPEGMEISSNGLISWNPNQGVYTSDIVEVKVEDDEGLYDIQSFSISVTQVDCNGDADGTAVVDDCGVCSGGLSDHVANSDKDCIGECFGNGAYDECGVCNGGN